MLAVSLLTSSHINVPPGNNLGMRTIQIHDQSDHKPENHIIR